MQFYVLILLSSWCSLKTLSAQTLPRFHKLNYGPNVAQQYPRYLNNQANLDIYGNLKVTRGILSQTYSPSFNAYKRPDLKPTRGFGGSQNFNVGYSLSLTNGKLPKTHHVSHDLDYSDIITGKPKDNLSKPTNFNKPSLYGFSGPKKLKHVSMYKKVPFAPLENSNEYSVSQSNIFLNKNQFPTHQMQQNSNPGTWKTVSPAIEIYQSKEVPFNDKHVPTQSQNFDHQKALGRSQGFDYSNVIDAQHSDQNFPERNNEAANIYAPKTPQISDLLTFPSTVTIKDLGASPSLKADIRQNIDYSNFKSLPISLPKLQYDTKTFPQIGTLLQKGVSKLPLDTSLLRNPISTIDLPTPKSPSITIDTSKLNLNANAQNPIYNLHSQNIDFTKHFQNQEPKSDTNWVNFHQEKMLHFDNQENNKNVVQFQQNSYQDAIGSHTEAQTSPQTSLFQSLGTNGAFAGKYNFDNGVDLKPPPFLPRKTRYP